MPVKKPADGSYRAVHDALVDIVTLSLDSDPKLVPHSAKRRMSVAVASDRDDDGDATPKSGPPNASVVGHTDQSGRDIGAAVPAPSAKGAVGNTDQPDPPTQTKSDSESDDQADPTSHDPPSPPPEGDPDDFVIMDEQQARRIVSLCQQIFGVDLSVDVVVADANVGTLAQRIVGARSLVGIGGE